MALRVDLVDPPAYSPPYDHALAAALAAHGADVRLITSAFAYGEAPAPHGYRRETFFYRGARGPAGSRARTLTKLISHPADMLRYRRVAMSADVVHFQWLTLPALDLRLLPRRPLVLTIHDPLRRGGHGGRGGRGGRGGHGGRGGRGGRGGHGGNGAERPADGRRSVALGARAFARVDAIIVHSEHARAQVIAAHGLEPERVHVIRHGVLSACASPLLDGVRATPGRAPARADGSSAAPAPGLPRELPDTELPVVLCFGLIRPYKGIETLLKAWRGISGAELWIVGRAMIELAELRAGAPAGVRFLERFVSEQERAALYARADLVVLPYERSERFGFSGALAGALGAGKAIVLSDLPGLREVAGDDLADPAVRLLAPGDPAALHDALGGLLADPTARARLERRALELALGAYSWDAIACQTLRLYARVAAR